MTRRHARHANNKQSAQDTGKERQPFSSCINAQHCMEMCVPPAIRRQAAAHSRSATTFPRDQLCVGCLSLRTRRLATSMLCSQLREPVSTCRPMPHRAAHKRPLFLVAQAHRRHGISKQEREPPSLLSPRNLDSRLQVRSARASKFSRTGPTAPRMSWRGQCRSVARFWHGQVSL